ncbi:putative 15-hydroxyprostaglandin dehydrogenase (NAD) [Seiridium cardinale]
MSEPVAIVTGAASGMGLAATRHLLGKGYRVVMADINELGSQLSSELGDNTLFHKTDVSSYQDLASLFSQAFRWGGGRVDLLAANAGIDDKQSLYQDNSSMALDENGVPSPLNLKTIQVDLESVFQAAWLFKFYARQGKTAKGGKIIVTASAGSFYAMETNPQYTAAKHGLVGFVRSAGPVMLRQDGITVNCFCPGFVMTGICPPEMKEVFPPEHITPMSTIMKAFDMFIEDDNMTGQCIEASLGNLYPRLTLPFVNSSQRWIVEESGIFRENKDAPPMQKF